MSARGFDLLAFGEALIDMFPDRPGSYAGVRGFAMWPGGAPANVVQGVASAGWRVAFLGKLGPDPLAVGLIARMEEVGVDMGHIVRAEATPTGITFVLRAEDGERAFFPYRFLAADKEIRPDEIPEAAFAGARVVHLGANTMALPAAWQSTRRVLELAEAQGAILSLDPNLRAHFHLKDPEAMARVWQIAARCHLVKLSREEAVHLAGSERAAVERLLAGAARLVVVTRDRDGAAWWHARGHHGARPAHATEVVDATGAGDAFMAGLLSRLLALGLEGGAAAVGALTEDDVAGAVEQGNRFGATCVATMGATARWPAAREEGAT